MGQRMKIALGIAMAALLGSAAPAIADDIFVPLPKDMEWSEVAKHDSLQFSLVPSGRRNVLVAWGGIDTGDSERFRAALDAAAPIDEVWLDSPGGALEEGMEMGRILRARRLTTRIPRGLQCISACNFIFMGGKIRYVETGGVFGVHMFASNAADMIRNDLAKPPGTVLDFNRQFPQGQVDPADLQAQLDAYNKDHADDPMTMADMLQNMALEEDTKGIQQDSAQTAAEIARFLVEMSLSLRFLTEFAAIPNSAPRGLTRQELRDFNVINTD
jgi:hypothetical protein